MSARARSTSSPIVEEQDSQTAFPLLVAGGSEWRPTETPPCTGAKLTSHRKPCGHTAARSPYRYRCQLPGQPGALVRFGVLRRLGVALIAVRTQERTANAAGRARQRRPDLGKVRRSETKEREVTGQQPKIDLENVPVPAEGILVTHFLTVRDVARSRAFYADVLGGQVVLEENPCIVKLANGWIIMNPGGGPTPDKPGISVVPHEPSNEISSFLNLRVADIYACYRDWKAKGATFVTEPIDRVAEVRCYLRDPDGYLIEVGQATGMLEGKFAKKRPEDLPG